MTNSFQIKKQTAIAIACAIALIPASAQDAYLTPNGIMFVQSNGVIITPDGPIIPLYRQNTQKRKVAKTANSFDPFDGVLKGRRSFDSGKALNAAFAAMDSKPEIEERAFAAGERTAKKLNKRSRAVRAKFQRETPCPSTNSQTGACPGWIVDHVKPLCAGGPDEPGNMQWQTVEDARMKDREERTLCRSLKNGPLE